VFSSSIVGHSGPKTFFARTIAERHLAHGYLFAGPEGVGKMTFGVALARYLLCKGDKGDDACGECGSCRRVAGASHPDLHVIELDPTRQVIRVEELQAELLRPMWLKAYEGGWRVFIIDGAHTLRKETSNRLLKVLEEPPGDTLIVLVSDQPSRVLPTLVSRCARVNFAPLSPEEVRAELAARTDLAGQELETLARYSRGRLGYALDLSSNPFYLARGEFFEAFVHAPTQRNFEVAGALQTTCAKRTASKSDERRALIAALAVISRFFADLLALQNGVEEASLFNVDRLDLVRSACECFSSEAVHDIIRRVQETAAQLRANIHTQTAVATLVTDILCLRVGVVEPAPAYERYLASYAGI